MRPDTRPPVRAHRASPPPCRRFGTVLLATKRHPASAASAFTRVRPDIRLRRAGGSAHRPLAADCPPRKAPGPSCRRRRTADVAKHPLRATSSRPGRPRTLGHSARPTRRKRPAFPGRRPDAADPKYAPYYARLIGNVPAPTSPVPPRSERTRTARGPSPAFIPGRPPYRTFRPQPGRPPPRARPRRSAPPAEVSPR